MTRRAFVQSAAAPMLVMPQQAPPPQVELTIAHLVDRIRAAVGPWREKTVDGFKAGEPSVALTGVAVTVAARLENLRRAASAGCNLVIAQEPVFYGANDEPGNRASDAVYLAKRAYIDQAKLVVWRFSDHWNTRQPDPRVVAIADALGWKDGPGNDNIYRVPETSLSSLMAHVSKRLGLRGGMRTVGPPDLRVRTVLVSPGTTDLASTVARLKGADVVLAGEPREWEVVPYVLDAREAGAAKALISVGRIVSEEPGMRACAAWIRTLAPGLRVEALPVSDPFWNAAS
ncbi:MAG TPA: Nif3-like dinuclear metal center hexameric protein [Vicinamibacterales bacterium]|nr:Nif3-like dinuclear metal center hexameric protein [Vicinamibacterales bacterium]